MAGFHATPSRRITVLYSIIVYVIRFKSHHYIDNRRYENDGLGRIGVSGQTSSITTSVQGGMWGDARMAARRLAWERLARSLLSCVSSSHRSNSVGPNRSRGSISRTTR